MKNIAILFTLFVSFNALAARVVLLSSLDTPKIWYHSKDWEIEEPLEKIFLKHFKKSGYEIVIKEKVDQETLWKELHNPENIALFWVSHAKEQTQLTDGISNDAAVVDYYGNDVKDLFKNVHPNMKFLSLVGCNAESLINNYKSSGEYSNNPNLRVHSFDKKIDARKGLRKSIKASAKSLGFYKNTFGKGGQIYSTPEVQNSFSSNIACLAKEEVFEISIERYTNQAGPSVALKINSKILTMLPKSAAGELNNYKFFVPSSLIKSPSDLKITIDSNQFYSSERIELGEFTITPVNFLGKWKLFAKKDGTPIGITKNLLRYSGEIPSQDMATEKQIYQCSTRN